MGSANVAQCRECGKVFTVSRGGGFFFHLLRCEHCGRTRAIGFDELGDLHLRYLKGSPTPYSAASVKHDELVAKCVDVEPISATDYWGAVEVLAGCCDCGGKNTFDAPARCPACRSLEFEEGPELILYD
jgi:predicted Zn-ribbon and HTH transcriptional regulator